LGSLYVDERQADFFFPFSANYECFLFFATGGSPAFFLSFLGGLFDPKKMLCGPSIISWPMLLG